MTNAWTAKDTTSHQDHVIAHVLGATFLGYFIFDEVLYVLLDIGFIWTIFVDGEMGLLPHPVAIKELQADEKTREELKNDIDALLNCRDGDRLRQLQLPPAPCRITDVSFSASGERRRLLIAGDEANVTIETSLDTAEVQVYAS